MPAPSELQKTLWWPRRRSAPPASPLDQDVSVDVAIIGGGFTGMTAAWLLARAGMSVRLLEGGPLGGGASGLNAGFVVPSFAKATPGQVLEKLGPDKGRALLTMIGQAAQQVFDLVGREGLDCDAEQAGWMHVAHTSAMADELRARASAWQQLGRDVRYLDARQARARTSMRHCVGALYDPSGGVLDPLAYLHGLQALARQAGAVVHADSPVLRCVRDAGQWQLSVGDHRVRAAKVLLCTNAFADGAARPLGKAVIPLRVYQIATEPLPAELVARVSPQRNPVADTRANLFTYRLDRENRLITGGMAVVPVGAHARMARALVARAADELQLPVVPRVDHVWRGTAAMTTDFLPHVYEFGPGFWGGIGCNGRGITLTHALGQVLADVARGRKLAELPIPVATAHAIPMHLLAQLAPSVAIAQARLQDARALAA